MNAKRGLVLVAVLALTSGCAAISKKYESATEKIDSVNSKISSVRSIVSDVGDVKRKTKRITGQ